MFRLMVVLLLLLPLRAVQATHNVHGISGDVVSSTIVSARVDGEGGIEKPQNWPLNTQKDLTAIYQALKFDHPARMSSSDDVSFAELLQQGYQHGLIKAQNVSNYIQYRAVLTTYTAMFDDLQVSTRAITEPKSLWWPSGIAKFNQGFWVNFARRYNNVEAMKAELERYQNQILEADYVVLDVRGSGGDGSYADQIAGALFGNEYTQPVGGHYSNSSSRYAGQVILLTDDDCFSSCLHMTDLFLRLGAVQVGRTTDVMHRYYDTKQIELPSGFSTFVSATNDFGAPRSIGPFKPRYIYDGDMKNTQKLKSWVSDLLAADRD